MGGKASLRVQKQKREKLWEQRINYRIVFAMKYFE